MANYTYSVRQGGSQSWIQCLRIVNPVGSASSSYSEIHFTEPKVASMAAMAAPHVTFVRTGARTHWYLTPVNGTWVGALHHGTALEGEGAIAQKVIADAVQLNYIAAPAPSRVVDSDGFETKESKKGKKHRVKTSWQTP